MYNYYGDNSNNNNNNNDNDNNETILSKDNSSTTSSSSSIAMLSPPLSPFPKMALPAKEYFPSPIANADTPLASVGGGGDNSPHVEQSEKRRQQQQQQPVETVTKKVHHVDTKYKVSKHDPSQPLVSSAWNSLKSDPVSYYRRERAYLDLYPLNGPTWSNYVSLGSQLVPQVKLPPKSKSRVRRRRPLSSFFSDDSDANAAAMVTRSSARGSTIPPSDAAVSSPRPARPASRPSTPRPRVSGGGSARSSPAPSRVHDLSLSQLTDYSPPGSTLPPGKSLRAEWKGAPMDLSTDPNVHLLHPAEIHLASVLRLPADVYIDSKRRLFAEKVHRLRQGLPFRRTDSQKACRIDVNKASRLFSAFEKVGWLDDSLFTHFL